MACRGVHFAIDDETTGRLLAAQSDDALMEIIEEIEEAWDEAFLAETDHAWDAMHRALSDGSLNVKGGTFPLNRTILGGQHLHQGEDYIVSLVPKDEVPAVAGALAAIDDAAMRQRYDQIVPRDYDPDYGEEDREYTVGYFRGVVELFARAAEAGRAVIFTVDQ